MEEDEDEEVQPVLIMVKDSSRPDTPEKDADSNAEGDHDDSMEVSEVNLSCLMSSRPEHERRKLPPNALAGIAGHRGCRKRSLTEE